MSSATATASTGRSTASSPIGRLPELARRIRIPARLAVEVSKGLGALGGEALARRVRRPCFIVGCGRSGTTMLNYLFNMHSDVANFPSEANDLWHPRMYPWHESQVESPPFLVDPRRFTDISLAQRRPEDDRSLRATFGAYQALSRKPVFLQKSVMVTFMMDKVLDLFTDARFVHLVRDGRAVALSWVVKERGKMKRQRYVESGLPLDDDTLLETYVRHWQQHVLALDETVTRLGLRGQGRVFETSYEELCADPPDGLRRLADFLDVPADPFLRADLSHIHNTNWKSRERLQGATLERLTRAAAIALERKGYGPNIV